MVDNLNKIEEAVLDCAALLVGSRPRGVNNEGRVYTFCEVISHHIFQYGHSVRR